MVGMATPKRAATNRPRNKIPKVEPVPMSKLGTGKEQLARRQVRGGNKTRPVKGTPRPIPIPPGKTRAQIAEMDPDDPAFLKNKPVRRKTVEDRRKEGFISVAQGDKQRRQHARKARVRKLDSEIMAAKREASMNGKTVRGSSPQEIEGALIAAGELTLDDWDDQELIRGYRRNRDGKFGPPPKWIPQEVAQEIHRRVLKRGGKKMLQAYLQSVDDLVALAQQADSEKVKLEAIKELQNRIAGKVPDKVMVSADDPWADMLADAYVPVSEVPPLDIEGSKRPALEAPSSQRPVEDVAQGGPTPVVRRQSSDGKRLLLTEDDDVE